MDANESDAGGWRPPHLTAEEAERLTEEELLTWRVRAVIRLCLGIAITRSNDMEQVVRDVDCYLLGQTAQGIVADEQCIARPLYLAAQEEWRRLVRRAEESSWGDVIFHWLSTWEAEEGSQATMDAFGLIFVQIEAKQGIEEMMRMLAEQ